MKKILLTIIAAFALVGGLSAQSRTSYFMEGSYFRNSLNPALAPTRGYIALPGMSGVGLNLSSNFLSIDNFVFQRDNQLVTAFHGSVTADEFLGKLPSQGNLSLDTEINLLGVGFYTGKTFWTFGLNANMAANMAMSMDAFKALKSLGNGIYDLGNTAFDATSYLDAYVGTSFRLGDHINVGVKAKFLVGVATLNGQFSELTADVNPDYINAEMSGSWRANGIMFDNSKMGSDDMVFGDMLNFNLDHIFGSFKNYGLAVDLGAEVRLLNDHLKVSAAITDLGFIKWGPNTHVAGTIDGGFGFNGFDFETAQMLTEMDFDMGVVNAQYAQGYSTLLNFSVNVGAEYNFLQNRIAVGLLSHTKYCNVLTYSELIASVNFRPTNWISATVSHTFVNKNRLGIFGCAINFHPCALNLYAGVDFIDAHWVKGPTIGGMQPSLPRYAKSANAYIGFGFNFGRPKFMKE